MNAYQCDRCFAFYTRYGPQKQEESVLNTARRSYRKVGIICENLAVLDLCPSCKKSFKHWFENPYIDEESKKEGEAEC